MLNSRYLPLSAERCVTFTAQTDLGCWEPARWDPATLLCCARQQDSVVAAHGWLWHSVQATPCPTVLLNCSSWDSTRMSVTRSKMPSGEVHKPPGKAAGQQDSFRERTPAAFPSSESCSELHFSEHLCWCSCFTCRVPDAGHGACLKL